MNIDVAWPVKNLSNRVLIVIPLVVAALFGATIAYNWNTTGDPVPLSMDFSGGSFVRVQNIRTPEDVSEFGPLSGMSSISKRTRRSGPLRTV